MQKLKEGTDFYIENGFYVFTAHYLLNRGYCCGNGCRHCPYSKDLEKAENQPIAPENSKKTKPESKKS